jgi:hypothetical protein
MRNENRANASAKGTSRNSSGSLSCSRVRVGLHSCALHTRILHHCLFSDSSLFCAAYSREFATYYYPVCVTARYCRCIGCPLPCSLPIHSPSTASVHCPFTLSTACSVFVHCLCARSLLFTSCSLLFTATHCLLAACSVLFTSTQPECACFCARRGERERKTKRELGDSERESV